MNYVEAAVKQYFDGKSPATQAWLKELSELKALDVRMISDDSLKASLSAIRAYQEGTRTPVALPEPVTTAASEAAAPQTASQVNETASAPKTAPAPRAPHPAKARPAPAAQTDAKPLEAPALPSEAKPQNISEPEKKAAPEKQSRPAADAETKGGRA